MLNTPDQNTDRADGFEIQPHVAVVGVSHTWKVSAASENIASISGTAAQDMVGQPFGRFFSEEIVHRLRSLAQVLSANDPVVRVQECAMPDADHLMDITATLSGETIYFEIEEGDVVPGLATELEQVQRLIRRVARKPAVEQAATEAARTVRAFSGYDRVSIHRIGRNGLSKALGTTGNPPLASDPQPALLAAHSMAQLDHLHLIADTQQGNVALHFEEGVSDDASNLRGLCSLAPDKRVSEALRKAGIRGAMTIPIRFKEEMWGVFVCHSTSSQLPTVAHRSALALFSLLFGYELERLAQRRTVEAEEKTQELRDEILAAVAETPKFTAALDHVANEIREVVPHDGSIVWTQGRFTDSGLSVPKGEFERLFAYIQQKNPAEVLLVDRLSDIGFTSTALDADTTALMAIPISSSAQDCVLLFRQIRNDPQRVASWLEWEARAASALRGVFTEIQLKIVEESRADSQQFLDRQNLLIAELNHRVRNILNLIVGLVKQGQGNAATLDEYVTNLQARLNALAGAHDQLTASGWIWVPISTLLRRTLEQELDPDVARATLGGQDVALSPSAYASLSLVCHELATNARKYGGLSGADGHVDVSVTRDKGGALEVVWRETKPQSDDAPKQPGFGLRIIENAIPHELRGTAKLSFDANGLVAHFTLPPSHVRDVEDVAQAVDLTEKSREVAAEINIDGAALLLEDNLIISMDASDMLHEVGATEVLSCNGVSKALELLDNGDVTFALLDVNLGLETSLAVAEQLWNDGIPTVLATGYGAQENIMDDFPPLPVLTKPYTAEDLRDVLRTFRAEQDASI